MTLSVVPVISLTTGKSFYVCKKGPSLSLCLAMSLETENLSEEWRCSSEAGQSLPLTAQTHVQSIPLSLGFVLDELTLGQAFVKDLGYPVSLSLYQCFVPVFHLSTIDLTCSKKMTI
jgi:hypothetical protein